MNNERRTLLQLLACAPLAACSGRDTAPATGSGGDAISRLRPLFKRKRPPEPGDWLETHKEPGQTYQQFRAITPAPAASKYSTLRIVPIGPLSPGQQEVMNVVTDFLQPFFGLQLVMNAPVPLEAIPEDATRRQSPDGPPQLLTSYLLNSVLLPLRQPADAAVLAITAADLWPGPGWNFVFGQASLKERVGVWSMARNGLADRVLPGMPAHGVVDVRPRSARAQPRAGSRGPQAWISGSGGQLRSAEPGSPLNPRVVSKRLAFHKTECGFARANSWRYATRP